MLIPSTKFWPIPRTNAALVILTPKNQVDYASSRKWVVLRELFLHDKSSQTVRKGIARALSDSHHNSNRVSRGKKEDHRFARRQTKTQLRNIVRQYQNGPIGNLVSEESEFSVHQTISKLDLPNGYQAYNNIIR